MGRHAILHDLPDILQWVVVGALGRLEQVSDVNTTLGSHTHYGIVFGIVVLLHHQAAAAPTVQRAQRGHHVVRCGPLQAHYHEVLLEHEKLSLAPG